MVNQIFSFPLRPVNLRPAISATKKNLKRLMITGTLTTLLQFLGYALCFFPGIFLSVIWALVAPVIMMEGLSGRSAMKRSRLLVRRSLRTTIAAVFIMFLVPFCIASVIGFFAATTVKSFSDSGDQAVEIKRQVQQEIERQAKKAEQKTSDEKQAINDESDNETDNKTDNKNNPDININVGAGNGVKITDSKDEGKMGKRIREVTREGLTSLLMLPFQLLIAPLSSIIVALLYLKTRQAGGESVQDLFEQFEESDKPRSNWQKRVRERLIQSGRVTSKS